MQIRPLTMSIPVGSAACNARCKFCVSMVTPAQGVEDVPVEINYKNWHQAMTLAQQSGVTTILLTGKGEPTLFPGQISEVLQRLYQYNFPIVELQTNGITIADCKIEGAMLKQWHSAGLRNVAISNVGFDPELNRQTYTPYRKSYIDMKMLVDRLHDYGFSVRLATVMIRGGIDNAANAEQMISWAKSMGVEQLTLRPVTKPHVVATSAGLPVINWIQNDGLNPDGFFEVSDYVAREGTPLLDLPHGGRVYDVDGQNVCVTNCLTHSTDADNIRQLIYFPDGHLRYSWEYPGAILI